MLYVHPKHHRRIVMGLQHISCFCLPPCAPSRHPPCGQNCSPSSLPHALPPLSPPPTTTKKQQNSLPPLRLPAHAPPLHAPHRPPRRLQAPKTARHEPRLHLRAKHSTKRVVGLEAVRGPRARLRVRRGAPWRERQQRGRRPRDVRPVRLRVEGDEGERVGEERGRRAAAARSIPSQVWRLPSTSLRLGRRCGRT